MPDKYWISEKWYDELGLRSEIAKELSISRFSKVFTYAVKELKVNPKLAAEALIQFPKRLKKRNFDISKLNQDNLKPLFLAYSNNEIVKDGIYYAMQNICRTNGFSESELFPKPASNKEIQVASKKSLEKLYKIKFYNPEKKTDYLIGLIMSELRGRSNGETIKKFVGDNYSEVK